MFLKRNLLALAPQVDRAKLPWRKNNISAYTVWVSEVMLQQTQVVQVVDYYTRFIRHFPTIHTLAKTTWEGFLPYYRGLGYYRRGRNMLKTAKIIVNDYHGNFPRDEKQLIALPGVGKYTASAILSFAFGENRLAFDTNLQKVFGRYLFGDKKAKLDVGTLEKQLADNLGMLSITVMDFASTSCRNRPKCETCILSSKCVFFKEQGKRELKKEQPIKRHFPLKQAQVFLWLQREHKEYYSLDPSEFKVFVLPSPCNTRTKIKNYFKDTFELEVSVRPPRQKMYVGGVPTIYINAQIISGQHTFTSFTRNQVDLHHVTCTPSSTSRKK